jgi:putative transferase (TIGR04331 family)
MSRILITTSDEINFVHEFDNNSFLLSGFWCIDFNRRNLISKHELLEYHWNDRKKLRHDHDYLKILYERILEKLFQYLNEKHDINKSKQYWRLIIGPWLLTYIQTHFDRWEILRFIFERQENFIYYVCNNECQKIIDDYDEFRESSRTNAWNRAVFKRIISFEYKERVTLKNFYVRNQRLFFSKNNVKNFIKIIFRLIDKIQGIISCQKVDVVLYRPYFNFISHLRIARGLGQVPRSYRSIFDAPIANEECAILRSEIKDFASLNNFEKYLFSIIHGDIPKAYLEKYKALLIAAKKIKLNPRIIFTANAHWGNELFKVWAAEEMLNNTKLIISEHGGGLPALMDCFDHEEAISYKRICWYKPSQKNHIQLPANKLIGLKVKTNGTHCSIIGLESPRFAYRAASFAVSSQTLDCLSHTMNFCDRLSPSVQTFLKIKPYPRQDWSTRLRYAERYGTEKVFDSSMTLYQVFSKSRLIVCTYGDTTFTEAIYSGLPTILVENSTFYERMEFVQPLMAALKNANLYFDNAFSAAEHVNQVWPCLDDWWLSKDVIEARKLFLENVGGGIGHPQKQCSSWVNFFRQNTV